jgi:orotate phosphoribosyltransferase
MMEMANTKQKEKLYKLIYDKAFHYSSKLITLSSGIKTHYYFDIKELTGDSEGIKTVSEVLYDTIKKLGEFKSVGGLESGSIPLSTAISLISNDTDYPLKSFYVRKKEKEHGMKKSIEGDPESPAVVVEDVVTTGNSALKAISVMREMKYDVKYLITVVYRDDPENAKQFEMKNGIKLVYVFSQDEFIEKYEKENPTVLTH